MKSNFPIKMIWQEAGWAKPKEVFVYDFMHDTVETFQSLALCWVPSSDGWATINVACLRPISKSKTLTEDTKDE